MAKMFFLFVTCVLLVMPVAAQSPSSQKRPSLPSPQVDPSDDGQEPSMVPDEMRARMEIARAEADYKKVLEDTDKLSSLSSEVAHAFTSNGKLADEDLKKVGAIEKLARRILSNVGGDVVSDDSGDIQHKPLNDAITLMSTDADKVQKCIKEQTRFVVSAVVIGNTNEIIHLTHQIRRLLKAE